MNSSYQTITFLFTDIVGSTQLWERCPSQMREALVIHDDLVSESIKRYNGQLFKNVGDGVYSSFVSARAAAAAAIDIQRVIRDASWPLPQPVEIRVALHTGEAQMRDGDYFGLTLSRAARLLQAGHGGQILCTDATEQFLRHDVPADVSIVELGDVRLRSLQRPETIYQISAADLQSRFPSLNSLESSVNNLPVQLTSFVGRDRELTDIRNCLMTNRLVTVTGPGGSGKTRIALQAAADLLDEFDRGVWLVELAAITDPHLVPSAIAKVLSVREEPGITLTQSIIRSYSGGKVLIILDNCEHLVESVATAVHGLLVSCTNVKVLATSRERLQVPGESLFSVPPMPLPKKNGNILASELVSLDSARLFVERATSVQPNFRLTDENAPSLAQICYSLDGIPLALELAAARSNLMTLDRMASRLTDRFRFLSGGSRTAAARQRTLEATIDWSYDLLTEGERRLLMRLAVFTGTWTLEAAEQVCSGDEIDDWEVLELLGALINKSLVSVDSNENVRYRLLESLRSYCLNKFDDAALTAIRARHANWCYDRVGENKTMDSVAWLNLIDMEIDNIRAAIEFTRNFAPILNLRLTSDLFEYWYSRGHLSEAVSSLSPALENVEKLESLLNEDVELQMLRSKAVSNLAVFQWATGDLPSAEATLHKSMDVCLAMGDEEGVAVNRNNLAILAGNRGDFDTAQELNTLALDYYRKVADRKHVADCLSNMGSNCLDAKDFNRAENYCSEAMSLYQADDNLAGMAIVLNNLSEINYHRMEFGTALNKATSALKLATITGNKSCQIIVIELAGASLLRLGDVKKAISLITCVEAVRKSLDIGRKPLQQLFVDEVLSHAATRVSQEEYNAASAQGRLISLDDAVSIVTEELLSLPPPKST